jgi:hypothetical protein
MGFMAGRLFKPTSLKTNAKPSAHRAGLPARTFVKRSNAKRVDLTVIIYGHRFERAAWQELATSKKNAMQSHVHDRLFWLWIARRSTAGFFFHI